MNVLRTFFANHPIRHYKKGDSIILQDTEPNHAFGIKEGIVKMYNLTADGEEKSILFNVADEVFPICWLFAKTKRTLYYYQAYTDCSVFVIEKGAFKEALLTQPKLAYSLLDSQVNWYVSSTLRINALEQSRASIKLLSIIHLLCLRHGEEIGKNLVRIRVPFTQQDLASYVGLTRETTTMELKKLKDLGVISAARKFYTVCTDKLNDLLEDEYNPGVAIS